MKRKPDPTDVLQVGCTSIRVRYAECDPMGVAHHSVYPVWFEIGRTALCRDHGFRYRDLEARGVFLAVVKLEIRYQAPARYDDSLELETSLVRAARVKLEHAYRLLRDGHCLTRASTTLACLDREGRPQLLPDDLLDRWCNGGG